MVMKSGPENVRAVPHQSAADRSQGLTDEEKTLKQTRSRNGCIGTWRTDNACDPQRRIIVPWIREWMHRRRDKRRKACLERVASVNGRNIRICKAVDSLERENELRRNVDAEKNTLLCWRQHSKETKDSSCLPEIK